MARHNLIGLFESRKGHLDYRLKRDYVKNGIATIPCRVSTYEDVISTYSVKGCETLNPEFDEYLKSTAELMPPELMLTGMLLSGVLLWFPKALADEPRELLYILFWFAGETLCDYLFLTGYELRRDRRLAGRLASIKVVFAESYEAPNYSKSDVDQLYSEIEKDVNETLHTVSSSTWKYP